TNIPPHNLNELAEAIFWLLEHSEASEEEALEACMKFVKGPDFPTYGLIVGDNGIKDAYTTGRGSIRMRGVTSIEEQGSRQTIVIAELPFQVNPDDLLTNTAETVATGNIVGMVELNG